MTNNIGFADGLFAVCPNSAVRLAVVAFIVVSQTPLFAQDYIRHREYQASATSIAVPFRLVGVVLNDNEDWLDPTADYDDYEYPGTEDADHLFQLGGEAEIFVQAVNLDGLAWDPFPARDFDDYAGTAVWMGQNYGNHAFNKDPDFSYPDAEWYGELDRLGFWYAGKAAEKFLVRKGDLIEITATVDGLHYQGKHNVNERHEPENDYSIQIIEKGFAETHPDRVRVATFALSDLREQGVDGAFVLDGAEPLAEKHQASMVELQDVQFVEVSGRETLTPDTWLTVTDGDGRQFEVYLGLDAGFSTAVVPDGDLNVTGILDQYSGTGSDGYRLLVMDPTDIVSVPEPTTAWLALAGLFSVLVCLGGGRMRRREVDAAIL
jgi:hypothetical protein